MEDNDIISLYWNRNQLAISETAGKYGVFLTGISMNILIDRCDAEECVNDTYHKAWTTIPPVRPVSLAAYLGKLVRNISISLYRAKHAAKRYDGADLLISELEECLPDKTDVESHIEMKFLTETINKWLYTLKEADRALFIRRYWNGDSIDSIAEQWEVRTNKLSVRLCRMRKDLKEYLEKEGIAV